MQAEELRTRIQAILDWAGEIVIRRNEAVVRVVGRNGKRFEERRTGGLGLFDRILEACRGAAGQWERWGKSELTYPRFTFEPERERRRTVGYRVGCLGQGGLRCRGSPKEALGKMTQVLNRHHYRNQDFPKPWLYIGRGTPLGNEVSKPGRTRCPGALRGLDPASGILRVDAQGHPDKGVRCTGNLGKLAECGCHVNSGTSAAFFGKKTKIGVNNYFCQF